MGQFQDRRDAGRQLATRLRHLRDEHPVVVGLPRGGVPVAFEVASALDAPLDVIVVRKLGVPHQPEFGMGAVGEDNVRVLNLDVVRLAGVGAAEIAAVEARERVEVQRRAGLYRSGRPMIPLAGRTVIVVDDGIATGGTARAALEVAQTTDDEVIHLLGAVAHEPAMSAEADPPRDASRTDAHDEEVEIVTNGVRLGGHLTLPPRAVGVVIFAHGSGSSRHSPRNQFVARVLNASGLGTLLFDLLTPDEALDRNLVFDIELLANRLEAVTNWLREQPECAGLLVGYFGASTGAAAALCAAAADPSVGAVVSRGGRPDLAMRCLDDVRAPTLLVVGGADTVVLDLNRQAADAMSCEHHVDVVPGATHLFDESGTLEAAAGLARDWFLHYLGANSGAATG